MWELNVYLRHLPGSLPLVRTLEESQYPGLADFGLDEDWLTDGKTHGEATIEELNKIVKPNAYGIWKIVERGWLIQHIPMFLSDTLTLEPQNALSLLWLDNALESVKLAFGDTKLPDVQYQYPKRTKNDPLADLSSNVDNEMTEEDNPSKENSTAAKQKEEPEISYKLTTKLMESHDDPNFVDLPEAEDTRGSGGKIASVLLKVSKLCTKTTNRTIRRYRCICSARCGTSWSGEKRDRARVLNHAKSCGYVASVDGGKLRLQVMDELSKKGKGKEQASQELAARLVDAEKEPAAGLAPGEVKVDPDFRLETTRQLSFLEPPPLRKPPLKLAKDSLPSKSDTKFAETFRKEGYKEWQETQDVHLVDMLAANAMAVHPMASNEAKKFFYGLNHRYKLPSPTTIADSLVPKRANNIRQSIMAYLRDFQDLQIAFDGGSLAHTGYYTITITTPHRQSFTLELDDGTSISHTGEYISEMIGRKVREVLAHMAHSTYNRNQFDKARKELGIMRGLEGIGETRFATVYWSGESVLRGIPALAKIVREPEWGVKSEVLSKYFLDEDDEHEFRKDLKRLLTIFRPIARAIQCLEASYTTPADVYRFWLAIVAHLHDYFLQAHDKIETYIVEEIRQIVNFRFNEVIHNPRSGNIYILAFFLEPPNRTAEILKNPNPLDLGTLQLPSTSTSKHPSLSTHNPRQHRLSLRSAPKMQKQLALSLLQLLSNEYSDVYDTSTHPRRTLEEAKKLMKERNCRLAHITPSEAIELFTAQFSAYIRGDAPFTYRETSKNKPMREWWVGLLQNPNAHVLATLAVKIFSALPNSISEERAVSYIGQVNSARRNQQKVSTVGDWLIIKQWLRVTEPDSSRNIVPKWRDMLSTIHRPLSRNNPSSIPPSNRTHLVDTEGAEVSAEANDFVDVLRWLDEAPETDYFAANAEEFTLETDFEISTPSFYDLLADKPQVQDEKVTKRASMSAEPARKKMKMTMDDALAAENAWTTWEMDFE
ncbi:ribonuclease H-like domain-containing protein [Flagelloscypha sp. PMI_526]|nr:ribonuclease H-like domain-containing protein [Flagelloscypha sp. PMI_526]KAH8813680.1 ribonuclease H-like domain-containing protein [Flagelloscypha sp. PMI_526]